MACEFSGRSLQVCRDFLQTAVIIDDRAYHKPPTSTPVPAQEKPGRGRHSSKDIPKTSSKNERGLDTHALTKSFADHGIICSVLEFTDYSENSISFSRTAKLADIAIIDWEMEDEKNGENALKLMSSLLEDDFSRPQRFRLISIYTAAVDLEGISNTIISHIQEIHNKELTVEQNGLRLVYQSIVITIFAKDPNGIPEHLQPNVVNEGGLPEKLVTCFSENISGLLPNTALSALTAIRHSTHRLLALFNRNLDYAYLTHRASLLKPDDAVSHLEVLIAEEIKSILSSYDCIGSNASYAVIRKWVEEHYPKNHKFKCFEDSELTREYILKCLKEGSENVSSSLLSKSKKKNLYQHFSNLLLDNVEKSEACDLKLSKLSILKTRYQNSPPHLTMGVILQQSTDKSLWVCIQPKCDSIRLEGKSNKFPLLPINSGKAKNVILPRLRDSDTENFFHISVHPQNCQSIEFRSARQDKSQILPKKEKERWVFLTTTKRLRFQFITELKDEIIQSILNDFAATTARVGTNPSEWLRKSGLEK